MAEYNSAHTGAEIDSAIGRVISEGDKWGSSASLRMIPATLETINWLSNEQTITVSVVLADETKQVIFPIPTEQSREAYQDSKITAYVSSNGQMTFTAEIRPSEDIFLNIAVFETN